MTGRGRSAGTTRRGTCSPTTARATCGASSGSPAAAASSTWPRGTRRTTATASRTSSGSARTARGGADVSGAWPISVGSTGGVLAMEGGKLRWYGPDGAARTDAFTDADLLSLLQGGGTGAEVRQDWLADGSVVWALGTARAMRFEPGVGQRSPVPAWLSARASATLAVVRGGRANAFATQADAGGECRIDVEVLTAGGESCGTAHLAEPGPCGTITFGADGTLFTTAEETQGSSLVCTWHWWGGLLR